MASVPALAGVAVTPGGVLHLEDDSHVAGNPPPLRLADVRGEFGVGHVKRVSRYDRLTTVADALSGGAIRQDAMTVRGFRRGRK
jgi:hypothetical protein